MRTYKSYYIFFFIILATVIARGCYSNLPENYRNKCDSTSDLGCHKCYKNLCNDRGAISCLQCNSQDVSFVTFKKIYNYFFIFHILFLEQRLF